MELIDSVARVFALLKDVNALDLMNMLDSLKDAIDSLLDLLVEICIFLREYRSHGFASEYTIIGFCINADEQLIRPCLGHQREASDR